MIRKATLADRPRISEVRLAVRENRRAFEDIKLRFRALVDVSGRKLDTTIYGKEHKMPIGIAPTGAAGMMWYKGELELARAARDELQVAVRMLPAADPPHRDIGFHGTHQAYGYIRLQPGDVFQCVADAQFELQSRMVVMEAP